MPPNCGRRVMGAPLMLLCVLHTSATASLSFAAQSSVGSLASARASTASFRRDTYSGSEGLLQPFKVSPSALGFGAALALSSSRGGSNERDGEGEVANTVESGVAPATESDLSVQPAQPTAVTTVPESSSRLGPRAHPPGPIRRAFPSFPWYRLPNILTYIRCVAIPLLIGIFYSTSEWGHVQTGSLFAVASFTDWLDGYLARRWDITSAFGAFLDPVADKLMVSTALILLSGRYGAIVAIPSAIILAREIAVSALREWMAQKGLRDSVKVGIQGKVKTAATMVALTLMLLVPPPTVENAKWAVLGSLHQPGVALLYLSALVTVTSGSVYFRAAGPVLLSDE